MKKKKRLFLSASARAGLSFRLVTPFTLAAAVIRVGRTEGAEDEDDEEVG